MGRIYSYTGSPVGVPADMQPHNLFSATVPPNALGDDGAVLTVEAFGNAAADASVKLLTVLANGVDIGQISLAPGDNHWEMKVQLIRQDASGNSIRTKSGLSCVAGVGAQPSHVYVTSGALPVPAMFDWTSPIAIAFTAQNTSEALANSIVGNNFSVSVD